MATLAEKLANALDPKKNPHLTQRICTRVRHDGVIVPKYPCTKSEALYNAAAWNAREAKKHKDSPENTYGSRTYLRLVRQADALNKQAYEAGLDSDD